MDLHERQQFDMLLQLTVERFVDRLEQRNEGAGNALARLRKDPQSDGVWLDQFVEAVFQDFVLNTPDGAAFVLRALAQRKIRWDAKQGNEPCTVSSLLQAMAMFAFGALLTQKTEEELERRMTYQTVDTLSGR